NSRLFLNALYIDVAKLDGTSADSDGVARLRESELVDYADVAALKWQALRSAFDHFKTHGKAEQRQDLEEFCSERGALLSRFACFEVLRHKFNTAWWEWPRLWQQPDDAACAALRKGPDAAEIEFVEFVQWIADRQLQACQNLAQKLGLKVGLYLDVAVGVQAGGFDAWNEQTAISRYLSVGAPPDPLNTAGQNWGLAGFNSAGLKIKS